MTLDDFLSSSMKGQLIRIHSVGFQDGKKYQIRLFEGKCFDNLEDLIKQFGTHEVKLHYSMDDIEVVNIG